MYLFLNAMNDDDDDNEGPQAYQQVVGDGGEWWGMGKLKGKIKCLNFEIFQPKKKRHKTLN